MSDAESRDRSFLVGGVGNLGFAVPMEDVRRLVGAVDLPPVHRRASLPRLLGLAHDAPSSRFAEVACLHGDTYLELGPDVDVVRVPRTEIEPLPRVLATTALRWGWAGLLHHDGGFRIVMDTTWVAALAASRGSA